MTAKKLTAIVLTLFMTIGLMTGCGTSDNGASASNSNNQTENQTEATDQEETTDQTETTDQEETTDQTETTAQEETTDQTETTAQEETTDQTETIAQEETTAQSESEGKKTLVVYYSATGNTKSVAETIAQITDGDLFEIEPKEPYTDDDLDWTNDDSRVSREHDDESLRDVELVSTSVDNWESYDTVYIGYPIWWGIAAWPVDNFVKNNDFTGKTVIPFCTAASSGIGESGKLLEDMAGTGEWKDGERFRGGAAESDIRSWIEELGL